MGFSDNGMSVPRTAGGNVRLIVEKLNLEAFDGKLVGPVFDTESDRVSFVEAGVSTLGTACRC